MPSSGQEEGAPTEPEVGRRGALRPWLRLHDRQEPRSKRGEAAEGSERARARSAWRTRIGTRSGCLGPWPARPARPDARRSVAGHREAVEGGVQVVEGRQRAVDPVGVGRVGGEVVVELEAREGLGLVEPAALGDDPREPVQGHPPRLALGLGGRVDRGEELAGGGLGLLVSRPASRRANASHERATNRRAPPGWARPDRHRGGHRALRRRAGGGPPGRDRPRRRSARSEPRSSTRRARVAGSPAESRMARGSRRAAASGLRRADRGRPGPRRAGPGCDAHGRMVGAEVLPSSMAISSRQQGLGPGQVAARDPVPRHPRDRRGGLGRLHAPETSSRDRQAARRSLLASAPSWPAGRVEERGEVLHQVVGQASFSPGGLDSSATAIALDDGAASASFDRSRATGRRPPGCSARRRSSRASARATTDSPPAPDGRAARRRRAGRSRGRAGRGPSGRRPPRCCRGRTPTRRSPGRGWNRAPSASSILGSRSTGERGEPRFDRRDDRVLGPEARPLIASDRSNKPPLRPRRAGRAA